MAEEELKNNGNEDDLETILDEFIMKPVNAQIPEIINIIVDKYLEFGISPKWTQWEKYYTYATRGLGYLLHNVPENALNICLVRTCRGGYKELAELIVTKGANDWDGALKAACRGGHPELVEFLIDKSSDDLMATMHYDENNILRTVMILGKRKREE